MQPPSPEGSPSPPAPERGARAFWLFVANYRVRISFFAVAALLLWNGWRGQRVHDPFDAGDGAGLAGALLVLLGALLRSWSAGILHKNQALATTGPYWFTRHPLYAGSYLIALGCAVVLGGVLNPLLVTGLFTLLYWPRMEREEATMRGLFGETWHAYTRQTARLLPRSLPPRLRAPWAARVWLRNGEYYAALSSLAALALLSWVAHLQAG